MSPVSTRRGILAAGNWVVDRVKTIDAYPERERLADILSETTNNGGAAYNLLKDLAKLKAPFPLEGAGLLGEDSDGDRILQDCADFGINTSRLTRLPDIRTSYTDVMSEEGSGIRTFFHCRGANAFFDRPHADLASSQARHFHLGYLLLLDKLDEVLPAGATRAAELLAEAQSLGFITSADLVSAGHGRFRSVVPPSLPHLDMLFVNEYEASEVTGLNFSLGPDGLPKDWNGARACLEAFIRLGIRSWVFVHFPGGACALSAGGEYLFQGAVKLPAGKVTGTVGAGDAFAAGVLLGAHEGVPMSESLRYGICAAAACIQHPSSSEGVIPMTDCLDLGRKYGFIRYPSP